MDHWPSHNITTNYITIYKIIHVYFKLYNLFNESCDLLNNTYGWYYELSYRRLYFWQLSQTRAMLNISRLIPKINFWYKPTKKKFEKRRKKKRKEEALRQGEKESANFVYTFRIFAPQDATLSSMVMNSWGLRFSWAYRKKPFWSLSQPKKIGNFLLFYL